MKRQITIAYMDRELARRVNTARERVIARTIARCAGRGMSHGRVIRRIINNRLTTFKQRVGFNPAA